MTTPRETTPAAATPPVDGGHGNGPGEATPPAAAPVPSAPAANPGPAAQPAPPAAPAAGPGERPGPVPAAPAGAVPRAGAPRPSQPGGPGPAWAAGRPAPEQPGRGVRPEARPSAARPAVGRTRRARLALRRIDPWSVFVFSLLASVFLGVALVVAVAVLYAVLSSLGVPGSLNQLFAEVTGGSGPLLTGSRIIGGAAVLAAVNIVLLTLLATLGALLYNVCASFTGGLELTLGDHE